MSLILGDDNLKKSKENNVVSKDHVYRKLFISTFYLSAFTFGGGYVIISLMKQKFVDDLKWLTEDEMLDLTAIAQSAPGPVAVNAALVLGFKIGGVIGALLSILGTVLPPLIILSVISFFYKQFQQNVVVNAVLKGMQSGVAAVIANVVLDLGGDVAKKKDFIGIAIMILAFVASMFFDVNIMLIIALCALFGAIRGLYYGYKKKKAVN